MGRSELYSEPESTEGSIFGDHSRLLLPASFMELLTICRRVRKLLEVIEKWSGCKFVVLIETGYGNLTQDAIYIYNA